MPNAPRTMPKAPPVRYQPTPPPGRRVYAHITSASVACPRCGALHLLGGKRYGPKPRRISGYDPTTASFRCRVKGCGYTAILGVVFWPVPRRCQARPEDQVLTPGQAAAARLEASYEAEAAPGGEAGEDGGGSSDGEAIGPPGGRGPAAWVSRARRGRLRRTNVECTCFEPCPVHGAQGEEDLP